jgi:outer membrane receptor protein involved in Fe transport
LLFGLVYDSSSIGFDSSAELASLDATRLAVPGGVLVSDAFTRLDAATANRGLYLSDTWQLSPGLAVTVSGRYNSSEIELRDRLGTALDGSHRFNRFNPAVGITAGLSGGMALYARYSEATRTPSPVELTCADPDDPCRLPNAFLADPPLEQVVAHSFEAGLRFSADRWSWHAGLFHTTNYDDILFISAGARTNQGYFDNVGQTLRQGIELNLDGVTDRLSWFANYTLVDATFAENLRLPSPNNDAAIDGEIMVQSGDRLPLIPRHVFQAGLDTQLGLFGIGVGITASSGYYLRGDEANDGAMIGNHASLNLRADYRLREQLRLFVNLDNVFDQEYETFGLFGDAADVLGSAYADGRFLSPAPPRAAWFGVEVTR